MIMHMSSTSFRIFWSFISTSARNCWATLFSASCGHSANQSMVQQFTREGNIRSRVRNASPTGLMQMTVCRFFRHCSMKKSYSSVGDLSRPTFLARGRTSSMMFISSSFGKRFGTSPVLRMLLRSSRKLSYLICVSLNRNTVCWFSPPLFRRTVRRSSRHSVTP